jgi:hypothetical protein
VPINYRPLKREAVFKHLRRKGCCWATYL